VAQASTRTRRPKPADTTPAGDAESPPQAPPAEPEPEQADKPAEEPAPEPAAAQSGDGRAAQPGPAAAPLSAPGIAVTEPAGPVDRNADAVTSAAIAAVAAGQRRICDSAGQPIAPEALFRPHGSPRGYQVVAQRVYQEVPAAGSTHTMLRSLLHAAGTVVSAQEADRLLDAMRQQAASTE